MRANKGRNSAKTGKARKPLDCVGRFWKNFDNMLLLYFWGKAKQKIRRKKIMWLAILISVGAVAIGLFFGLRQGKVNRQLMDEGRIVQRKYVITEQAEEFTLRGADFARVLQGIQNADLRGSGVSVQKNDANQVLFFNGSNWKAEMYRKNDIGDQNVWYFHFTNWKTYRGMAQEHIPMNILITAIEKMFLSIDPAAQVKNVPIKVKTKPSFF